MDLLMPVTRRRSPPSRAIKKAQPEVEIVAVTSFIEEDKVTAALEAGATGYLLKDAEAEEVADAVRAAYAGEVHLDPAVARLLAPADARAPRRAAPTRSRSPSASRRSCRSSARAPATRRSRPRCSSPSAPRART